MRELTKAELHSVFTEALIRLDEEEKQQCSFYMCNAIEKIVLRKFDIDIDAMDIPVFASKRPEYTEGEDDKYVWFGRDRNWIFDYESRRKVLTDCINETAP